MVSEMAPKVLIVDDDPAIRSSIRAVLQREGFAVAEAGEGREALAMVRHERLALVLLDLGLPDMNGLDVCKVIRQENSHLPIVVLSGKTDEIDKVLMLELGADDYVTKPFSPRELIARIRAVLRRAQRSEAPPAPAPANGHLHFGRVTIKLAEREVTVGGQRVQLTPTEFDLIAYLAQNPNVALSRDQLISRIWGYDTEGETRLLDSHIAHLRAKLEEDPSKPRLILTVRNVGYKLNPSPSRD